MKMESVGANLLTSGEKEDANFLEDFSPQGDINQDTAG